MMDAKLNEMQMATNASLEKVASNMATKADVEKVTSNMVTRDDHAEVLREVRRVKEDTRETKQRVKDIEAKESSWTKSTRFQKH